MDDSEIVRIIRTAVQELVAVYRFGSTVTGAERSDSDIDLAFLARQPLDPLRRFELQEQLAISLRRNVDLVDLRRASTVMRMQVVARGVVLAVCEPAEKARFETYAYSSYARLNEERAAILDRVRREGTIYGG